MDPDKKTYFEETRQLLTDYVEDRLLLIKMQVAEKAAEASSSIFKAVTIAVLLVFILMILSFLAGYYLSQLTGSILLGFGILAAIYVILLLVMMFIHKKYLNKFIVDKVITMFFQSKPEEL